MRVIVEGKEQELVCDFGNGRGIIKYEGIYVMVDKLRDGEYEMSGEPARPGDELETLNAFVATVETTTTVTKDD